MMAKPADPRPAASRARSEVEAPSGSSWSVIQVGRLVNGNDMGSFVEGAATRF